MKDFSVREVFLFVMVIYMMSHYFIAQCIGACAVLIALSVYQFNNRKTMLRLNMFAALLYAVSFFILGAKTGAAMNAVGSARCYAFSRVTPSRKNSWILILFLIVSVVGTVLTWQGPVSLLAMGGSLLGAYVFWQEDERIIRSLALAIPPLWFAYDTIVGSYPGMFIEVFNIISILIARYRFDLRNSNAQKIK